MFNIFKKKKKTATEVLNQEEMGELTYYDGFWEGKVESTILGKKKILNLWVYIDEDDKYNLKEQEKAFRYYIKNKESLEKDIELEMRSFYKLEKDYDINERFVPYETKEFDAILHRQKPECKSLLEEIFGEGD